jgi:hypothetical protein
VRREDTTLEAAGGFVSFDLTRDVAYVVHDCNSTLRWREISRTDAELLVAMGAHAQVAMEDGAYDQEVAARVREILDERSDVGERKMFGGPLCPALPRSILPHPSRV